MAPTSTFSFERALIEIVSFPMLPIAKAASTLYFNQ
jgi:hypothetical protein